ncbi:hypothetical protein J3R30DRAFT_118854 [Lentinula aciculospora]|uniref:Uncharacterized protein n=1 Tax=Lentinula aciculospora TaxID=153920 RepID=A0A9W9AU81_9AGAR|nr:hypothetical protein J3R30DRAFT_118854 [Lentinula aciculospora]
MNTELSREAQQPQYILHQIQYNTTTNYTPKPLLQEGAYLVEQVRNEDMWHNVEIKAEYNALKVLTSSRIITISTPPPQINLPDVTTNTIRDWHESPTPEEILALDDLEEFESTDLSSLFCTHSEYGSQYQRRKRSLPSNLKQSEAFDPDEPSKKFLRFDSGSLHRVIPQPHIQLSKSFIPPDFDAIQVYDRATPIYLPPHAAPSVPTTDDFGRRAWIIPARGFLPATWTEAGASSAVVLDPQQHDSSSLDMTTTGSTIKWSHFALKEFWKYLNTLRNLNNFGPLGISFQPAQNAALRLRMEKVKLASLSCSEAHRGLHSANVSSLRSSVSTDSQSGQSSLVSTTRSLSLSLRDCDYFKVYHDTKISMHLRHAFDIFTFRLGSNENENPIRLEQSGQSEQSEQSGWSGLTSPEGTDYSKVAKNFEGERKPKKKKPKYCLLRGAKLVLVDERSRGVLIA